MNRTQAFQDTLQLIVCSLGRPLLEDEYMEVVQRHSEGQQGRRGIDSVCRFFAELVNGMTESNRDLLGDLFEGSISRGEAGQFLTPPALCELMARLNLPDEPTGIDGRKTVADCCCGSGRMLLAAGEIQPNWQFIGQDVDLNCVRMTAINLGLRNLYGHVVWGNSLTNERRLVYETGRLQVYGNVIRKVSLESAPPVVQEVAADDTGQGSADSSPGTQLRLFD